MTIPLVNRSSVTALLLAFVILGGVCKVAGQELQIGIIDFYGLNRISAATARQALTFGEGDTLSMGGERPAFLAESEHRLASLPGVAHAQANLVCCEQGRAIVYVGIQEDGAGSMQFRAPPLGNWHLAAEITQAGDEFAKALTAGLQRGDDTEDDTQGHALSHDPATRAIQERFIGYAARDMRELRRVLRDASDPGERALAAQVLGYVAEKQAVATDLVYAMSDPSEEVRNNAMRALLVFARATPTPTRPVPQIPHQPFIVLLDSSVWSDRNKAVGALMSLSTSRDPKLLAALRSQAIAQLVEMARWKSTGHAMPAFVILGRIAGYADEATQCAWEQGKREAVIQAALNRR